MRLRTIGGAHAGTIQDYDYPAAAAALKAGMAERLDAVRPDERKATPPAAKSKGSKKRET